MNQEPKSVTLTTVSNKMKLQPELVPASAFYSNLRKILTVSEWDKLRKQVYAEHDHVCQICGDTGLNQGRRHKVECHEVWGYQQIDAEPWRGYQVLESLQCLCPMCHAVKHIGFQLIKGKAHYIQALQHMMKVNGKKDLLDVGVKVTEAFHKHAEMSKIQWDLSLEHINHHLKIYGIDERKYDGRGLLTTVESSAH